jgi:hypothetical protein
MTLGGSQQSRLFRVDCDRGGSVLKRGFETGCEYPAFVHTPILHGDLFIVIRDSYIRATHLPDLDTVWEFSCQRKDLIWLHEYLRDEESLHLLIRGFINKSDTYWDAYHDKNRHKFEIVELDCRTGEVLSRLDKGIFPGVGEDDLGITLFLGKWAGKLLVAFISELDDDRVTYSVYSFPAKKLATFLFEESDYLFYPGLYEATWNWHKPIVRGDTIFYHNNLSRRRPLLVARSLADGKILWKVEESRIPMASVADKLYTYSRLDILRC